MTLKDDPQESLEKTGSHKTDPAPSKLKDLSDSEVLQFPGITREHWWQLWRPRHSPPPPKATLEEAEIIPLAYVSTLSKLTFQMDPSREEKRQAKAQHWNDQLNTARPRRSLKAKWRIKAMSNRGLPEDLSNYGLLDTYLHRYQALELEWRQRTGRKTGSITWALNDVMTGFWAGGLFKVASDTSQLMIPLLIKALINFSKEVCLSTSVFLPINGDRVGGRAKHPNGKLLTYLSSDISRIDYCAQWFHAVGSLWLNHINLSVDPLVLLIIQIGPSALVGFSLFVLLAPLQTWFMKLSFKVRKKSMKWTDSRSRLLRELLSSMEVIKVFTYEIPFLKPFSVPALASVLAFVTYAATHDSLDPVFEAEVRDKSHVIDISLKLAVTVSNATFSWSSKSNVESEPGFKIEDLNLNIPRGTIVGIVGSVGSGKSSLLQGLIGEMSILTGSVTFGGRLAYCQQNAWIQNATVRDNILFGQVWDEPRYWKAVKDANLVPDLEILGDGDLTEVSRFVSASANTANKMCINLSGGQKQRVNIARALYYNADIVLFDDPLSAVDAHVGKALFENAIMPLASQGKTVLLVTHALHFLPAVDRIYFLSNGSISEQGTFSELSQSGGAAAKLFSEFGGQEKQKVEVPDELEVQDSQIDKQTQLLSNKSMGKAVGTGKLEGRLMVSEIRKTGSVVYAGYLHAGRSRYTFPLTVLFATIMQGSQVMATVWLTWWQDSHFNQTWSVYQGVYAALGISQAMFTFAMGATLGVMANLASQNLHSAALDNVFYSPKSVFDTQPLGRILGVFGKDIDTIDNQLPDSLRMMAMTLVTLIGSIAIITVFLHYFIAVIFFVGVGYW
ncbi:uncharacterized protein I206_102857 [Kwoniella pini CBS 10737]|uniref:ABC transporter domain-containing protein n=1 Tax=Kwoniella pini CBS 10737 TaxID=1296096 RepID=A0AAJ8L3Z7_9TREE